MKIKTLIILIIIFICPLTIKAYEVNLDWQIVREGSGDDMFFPTRDGGIIQFTYIVSEGDNENTYNFDQKIIKFDKNGKILWEKIWGGNGDDYLEYIIETNDGYLVLGYTDSTNIEGLENNGGNDIVLLKYDKNGNLINQNIFGGSDDEYFIYEEIIETSDNRFVILASTNSTHIDTLGEISNNLIIIKFTSDGSIVWNNLIDNDSELHKGIKEDEFITWTNMYKDEDNIYDLKITKYDKNNQQLWQRTWGGNKEDYFTSIELLNDNSIIAIGRTCSTNIDGILNNDGCFPVIIKYDETGKLLWQKKYGDNEFVEFLKIIPTSNMETIIISSGDFEGNNDIVILKYDKDGNLIFENKIQGNDLEEIKDIISINDNNFLISIYSSSESLDGLSLSGTGDYVLLKIDNNGEILYKNIIDNLEHIDFKVFKDNGFVVFGQNGLDAVISKYDKNGNKSWEKSWGGSGMNFFYQTWQLEDGNVLISAVTTSNDIEGITNDAGMINVMLKYSIIYNFEIINNMVNNGTTTAEQQGKYGIIKPKPNKGYEVDKIIVKDTKGNALDVELTALEDGTYSFPLNDDVTIEVLFKEVLSNPKTGIIDYISFILIGLLISIIGYVSINYNNKKYEL